MGKSIAVVGLLLFGTLAALAQSEDWSVPWPTYLPPEDCPTEDCFVLPTYLPPEDCPTEDCFVLPTYVFYLNLIIF